MHAIGLFFRNRIKKYAVSTLLICLCFLLTSTGWLAWEYHLMDQVSADVSDICTMVTGYLLQAAGIGSFAALLHFVDGEAALVETELEDGVASFTLEEAGIYAVLSFVEAE